MNPVLVEVVRGGRVESVHRGAVAVCETTGCPVSIIGNADAAVFPRSTVKPLQALPLLASGAVELFRLSAAEIAVACGSLGGDAAHVDAVLSTLAKAGCDADSLECGSHWPLDEAAARRLARGGEEPTPLHNNCSGKHAGFICVAKARGVDPRGYVRPEHPVMREVTATLEALCGVPLATVAPGIDGCSIPTLPMPLVSLATAFARFGTGECLPADLAVAAKGIREAITAHPDMVAGPGRFDTRVIAAAGGSLLVKSGAEGTACAAIPAAGLGIAVKIDDGAGRAVEVVLASLAAALLGRDPTTDSLGRVLGESSYPRLRNWNGIDTGNLRPSAELTAAIRGMPSSRISSTGVP